MGAVGGDFHMDAGRQGFGEVRQFLAHRVHGCDDIGAGLALHIQHYGGVAVVPGVHAVVFHAADDGADIAEAHGAAGAPCDDEAAVGVRRGELIVGGHRIGQVGAIKTAFGAADIGVADGGADILHRQAVGGQARGIQFHADGGFEPALDDDAADAVDLAEFGLQQGIGGVGHLVDGQGIAGDGEADDGGVGRVHAVVAWRVGQALGQDALRGIDGGLHILGGAVHAAGEIELESDLAGADGGGALHGGDAVDLAELAFQRGRDQGCHGIGAGTWIGGADDDGGEVHLRQGGDGQRHIAQRADQEYGHGEQAGGDGPGDERRGD